MKAGEKSPALHVLYTFSPKTTIFGAKAIKRKRSKCQEIWALSGYFRNAVNVCERYLRFLDGPPIYRKMPYLRHFLFAVHVFYTILFRISSACSSSRGYKWEYVFHVIVTFLCPSRRATSWMLIPLFASSDA